MTLEGEGRSEDATPAPPARTRWSEDHADDDGGLLPPYVPGAGARGPGAGTTESGAAPAQGTSSSESGFPFDLPAVEETPSAPVPAPSPAPDLTPAADPSRAPEPEEAESPGEEAFPFDSFDIEGGGEAGAEWTTERPDEVASSGASAAEIGEREWTTASSAALELAGDLERLAEALRDEGRAGAERVLGSADGAMALVAGVVAGYLAGRE